MRGDLPTRFRQHEGDEYAHLVRERKQRDARESWYLTLAAAIAVLLVLLILSI